MKKKIFALAIFSLIHLNTTQAQNGIYLTLDGGFANQSGLPTESAVNAISLDTSHAPNALRLGLGYNHDFNTLFGIGLDIGGGQYGKATYNYANGTNTSITSRTLEFLATGTFHLQKFDLTGKVGGLRLTPKVTGENAPSENTQIRFEGAITGAYNFTPHLAVTLTYAHVFGSQIDSISDLGKQTPGLDEGLLGIKYIFGS